jgi:MFS family permease
VVAEKKNEDDRGLTEGSAVNDRRRERQGTVRPLEWLNFFLADVQTGLGPFLAAYLASSEGNPGSVGYVLTFGGLVGVAMQTPAGAVIDAVHSKRTLLAVNLGLLVAGAFLPMEHLSPLRAYAAQFLIGSSGPFLAPTVAAITLGMVGAAAFDKQFGKNQAFNAAGNVFTALLAAYVSYRFGYRAIFAVAALLVIPAAISLFFIDAKRIDYARARGAHQQQGKIQAEGWSALLRDRILLCFLATAFLFHLANAAMLPELGEMLSKDNLKAAAPFMSACIIVTQLVITISAPWIGKRAASKGQKPLLLLGFGVLCVRGVLYTLTHAVGTLIAIQVLDGVANAIFVIVSIVVIKDRTQGTGRFNVAAGALATMVGIGAAASTTIGGVLIQHSGYRASFLGLAGIAVLAVGLHWLAIPETLSDTAIRPPLEERTTPTPWVPRLNPKQTGDQG